MRHDLYQRKLLVGETIPQVLNLLVAFITTFSEVFSIIEYFANCKNSNVYKISAAIFVLYIGTILPLFANELVYEPIENHPKIHKILLISSGSGCLLSLSALLFSVSNLTIKYAKLCFYILQIVRCIIVCLLLLLTIFYFCKVIILWYDERQDEKYINMQLEGKSSEYDSGAQ